MTSEEAKEILTHNWTRVDNPNYSESELDEAVDMAIEALKSEPVVRCKDCKYRYGYECPMYYVEWFTIDEYDRDFRVVDNTQDDGFCYQGERKEA